MMAINGFLAVLLAFAASPAVSQATYWINQFPLYSSMKSCAMAPVNAIVRGMSVGCGDGNAYTSYSCFCSASSTHMVNVIASSVSLNCDGTLSDIVTALAVFQSYCDLGNAFAITTSASSSSTASSSSVISTTAAAPLTVTVTSAASTATQTGTAVGDASDSLASTAISTGAKAGIAIGVVALILAAAALAAFIYYRRRSLSNSPHGSRDPRGQDPFTLIDTSPSTARPLPQTQVPSQEAGLEWQQISKSPSPTYVASEKAVSVLGVRGAFSNAYGMDSDGQVHEMSPVTQPRHELS